MASRKIKGSVSVHDGLVFKLRDEIIQSSSVSYKRLETFYEYCRRGLVGEVDLLAMADEFWDFYEIKCNPTRKAVRKAYEQYERFQQAFPNKLMHGFMYTCQGLRVL